MNEHVFIKQLQSRSQTAFNTLLNVYQNKVYSTCLSFVPSKEDAEDLAQEVFVEVYKSISHFKGEAKLSSWIYRITTNKCLEFIRKKNTKKRFAFLQSISGNDVSLDQTNFFTEFNHPGVLLENKEQTALVFKAINELPDSQRIVFTLAKIDEKSYQEIVEITGKSLSSIESIMFRAKRKLQEKLKKLKNT